MAALCIQQKAMNILFLLSYNSHTEIEVKKMRCGLT